MAFLITNLHAVMRRYRQEAGLAEHVKLSVVPQNIKTDVVAKTVV